jgi:hypothetical protein
MINSPMQARLARKGPGGSPPLLFEACLALSCMALLPHSENRVYVHMHMYVYACMNTYVHVTGFHIWLSFHILSVISLCVYTCIFMCMHVCIRIRHTYTSHSFMYSYPASFILCVYTCICMSVNIREILIFIQVQYTSTRSIYANPEALPSPSLTDSLAPSASLHT